MSSTRSSPLEDPRPVRRRRAALLPWSLALALLLAFTHLAPPVRAQALPRSCAVVTDLSGTASLQRAGAPHALAVLDYLFAADELQLERGTTVELVTTDGPGRVYTLSGPGRFGLRAAVPVALDARGAVAARDPAQDWRALQLDAGALGRASVSLRGAPDGAIALLAPVGTVRVDDLDRLRWTRPYGRPSARWTYELRLVDADGTLVFATRTGATELAWPGPRPGMPARPYLWTVIGTTPDGRRAEGSAEFRVVDAPLQARIEDAPAAARQARGAPTGPGAAPR